MEYVLGLFALFVGVFGQGHIDEDVKIVNVVVRMP